MKMTLNLPHDLVQTIKFRAVLKNATLQKTISELLTIGLAHADDSGERPTNRVRLPIFKGKVTASQLTPAQLSELLTEQG
jgi:hypothetical protein